MRRRIERGILSLVERAELAGEGLSLAAADFWHRLAPLRALAAALAQHTRRAPLVFSLVYVALFCTLSVWTLDRPLALWLRAHVGGDLEGFFKVVTRLGEAEFYMVPAGILWVFLMAGSLRAAGKATRDRLRRLSFAPAFLFLSIAISGLISNAFKWGIGRYRPRYLFEQGLYGFQPFNTEWGMNSFPSGHSQAAFAAMTALWVIFPRYDLFWFLIAVLVAASRVVTTVHYLSDAVAGSFLAIAVALLLARAFRARGIDPTVRPYSSHSPL